MPAFKTHEQYEQQLFERQIDFYPVERYISARKPILHECLKGHQWLVRPDCILKGRGCPTCSQPGFNYKDKALLYFISFQYRNRKFYKLGMTNKTLKQRFGPEWDKLQMNTEWLIQFDTGEEAFRLEQELKDENYKNLVNTGALRKGNTETFDVYISKPLERVIKPTCLKGVK